MRSGYLGLGSNVGNRESHLRAAVELLRERGVEVEAISSTYETEPVGEVLDQPDFLNAAIRIRTDLEPEALLDLCKEIEVRRGRALDALRHSPRPLDVDLLLLGDLELSTCSSWIQIWRFRMARASARPSPPSAQGSVPCRWARSRSRQ